MRKAAKNPKSLKEISKSVVKAFNEVTLESVYANYTWPLAEQKWCESIPVSKILIVKGTNLSFKPVYAPERVTVKGRTFLQVKCLDGHHIRTNIRTKLCKDGADKLDEFAWKDVASAKTTPLTMAMIEMNKNGKILDQQNDKLVRTMFSYDVGTELRRMGHESEVHFTNLVRD